MRRAILLLIVLAAPLAGCGKREALKPLADHALAKPATAAATPTVDQLLTPTAQSRPERVDEVLRKSTERRTDRFDLPPPG